jgi:Uma2 family endonuclease
MHWNEIVEDPNLRDLPFKIETNEWGQVILSSAATPKHSRRQYAIIDLLIDLLSDGEALPECAIETAKGIKVPDVVWASNAFLRLQNHDEAYTRAPEICIEVMSKSNTDGEMQEKCQLLLRAGATEFWLCGLEGEMLFWNAAGSLEHSLLVPTFPLQVVLAV